MWPLRKRVQTPRRPKVQVELNLPKAPPKKLKLLMDLRPEAHRSGPGPSKIMYRLTRAWRKVWVRRASLVVLPLCMIALIVWRTATDPAVIEMVAKQRAAMVESMASRPEFAVHGLRIRGASEELRPLVEMALEMPEKASSLNLEVGAMQARVVSLAAVRDAHVTLGADGMLDVAVDERVAEALWRDAEGGLWLVDRDGVEIASVTSRADKPGLPLVLGRGAPEYMTEALSLFNAVPDLQPRMRALIRIGERRWNVALDKGLTILLPEIRPTAALERVMAWHFGEELLDRSLVAVDMRIKDRPTLRMSPGAAETYRIDLERANGEGEET